MTISVPRRSHVLLTAVLVLLVAVPVTAHAVASRLAVPAFSCSSNHPDQMWALADTFESGRPATTYACIGGTRTEVQVRERADRITMTFPALDRTASATIRTHLVRDRASGSSWTAASFTWQLQVLDALDVFAELPKYDMASVSSEGSRELPPLLTAERTAIDLDGAGHLRIRFNAPVTVDEDTQLAWYATASQQ